MYRFGVVASLMVSAVLCVPLRSMTKADLDTRFKAWMTEFEMDFADDAEYLLRLGIFAENLRKIESHNSGNFTWKMGVNKFAHLTSDEFKEKYIGDAILPPLPKEYMTIPRESFVYDPSIPAVKSWDWVEKGAVTDVKNQERCGGCWAFSTTGAMEGAYFVKNSVLKSFSEQELISCDKIDSGCNGGLMDNAFKWIKENGGICEESAYPYVSGRGKAPRCKRDCEVVSGTDVKSFTDVSPDPQIRPCTNEDLEQAVQQQPVSVAIEADQNAFQLYHSGVLTGKCGTKLDHGVLVVGYGGQGLEQYWKVKNSWGGDWGEDGYIRLGKGMYNGEKGQCGVLLSASYPTLSSE